MNKTIEFVCGELRIAFPEACGGFPGSVSFEDDRLLLLHLSAPPLEAELGDGRVISPFLAPESRVSESDRDGAHRVEFHRVRFRDRTGREVSDFFASFKHEFLPDGTAFSEGFFFCESFSPPELRRFELKLRPDFSGFEQVNWSFFPRPRMVDGALIQTSAPERNLPGGTDRILHSGIFPMAGFNCRGAEQRGLYAEFFVEGENSLCGHAEDNSSGVRWIAPKNPELSWNFQSRGRGTGTLPWQWRNHWGWVIRRAPRFRRMAPQVMYHYFDNFRRYPEPDQLRSIAAAGGTVLCMHENWRLDAQNGGDPYDDVPFRRVVKLCHELGIRIAVYIRGNENSVVEHGGSWFPDFLRRNFDGLYMDYGGPFHRISPPDESFQGGRIHFRAHYRNLERLRNTIGEEGIFYSHTGPMFSALGLSFTDGYVSGEGERGALIRNRADHGYFSMSDVVEGTMWTAAFPEYSSPRMVPFLAATGQIPHNPLGTQMKSSSLVHPPSPGVNDRAFRELWRLWKLFETERNVTVWRDGNCRGRFPVDPECGHYMMVSADRKRRLLILSNFSATAREVECSLDGSSDGMLFQSGTVVSAPQRVWLSGYGVAGIGWGISPEFVERYRRPDPAPDAQCLCYLEEVERQRRLRRTPPYWKRLYLSVRLPFSAPASYEESLISDLFDNRLELGVLDENGRFHTVAPIGEAPLPPGGRTPALCLNLVLKPGFHRLGVRSIHGTELFYSFIVVTLSPEPDLSGGYEIEFRNELESDRALLTFDVSISS